MKNLITFILAILLVSLLSFIWFRVSTSPKSTKANYQTFVVAPGASLSEISKKLKKEGIIKNSLSFRILVAVKGFSRKIQAGVFKLSPHMTAAEIVAELTEGTFDVWITIPEGWRITEIAEALNSKLGIDKGEFIKNAKEGFMFPDTYLIPKEARGADVAKIMRDNFDKRVDESAKNRIFSKNLTLDEVIILASIVEREAKFDSDRSIVAGILLKRWKAATKLDADATVQYAVGYQENEASWWKKTLTEKDLEIDSPYNTRKFAGLPPGPICNPGLAAIAAVITPAETDFFYYLSDKEGKMHYAKTLNEHIENIRTYL